MHTAYRFGWIPERCSKTPMGLLRKVYFSW